MKTATRIPRSRTGLSRALCFDPLALMTTYPAMALLGTLERSTAGYALLGGCTFAVVTRLVWKRALANYTSASS